VAEPKLKPCPFCGGVAVIIFDNTLRHKGKVDWFVKCRECETQGPVVRSKKAAIAAWNKRAGEGK